MPAFRPCRREVRAGARAVEEGYGGAGGAQEKGMRKERGEFGSAACARARYVI